MEGIFVGIDIGTTKVCTLIGRVNESGQMEIMGKGMAPCSSVKKGVIVDIDGTSNSIALSVEQAQSEAGLKVYSAYVNIPGMHINALNVRNSINVSGDNREISSRDVQELLRVAKNVELPEDMDIIDVIPRQYIVDGYDEIIDPVGMVGTRLEVDTDIIAGKITSIQNIIKSLDKAGIKTNGIVPEAFASGVMALSQKDRELGVVLIDVGGGITDISVFKNNRLMFCDSIPVGGDHVTNDISIGLKISYAEAEKIKKQYGLALVSLIDNDQDVWVYDVNDNYRKSVKISEVVEITEARVYEILSLCRERLEKAGLYQGFGAGVVLTGRGISYLDGIRDIADEVFGLDVRIASANVPEGLKPEFATAAGIIKYVSGIAPGQNAGSEVKSGKAKSGRKEGGNIFKKLSKLISDLF